MKKFILYLKFYDYLLKIKAKDREEALDRLQKVHLLREFTREELSMYLDEIKEKGGVNV